MLRSEMIAFCYSKTFVAILRLIRGPLRFHHAESDVTDLKIQIGVCQLSSLWKRVFYFGFPLVLFMCANYLTILPAWLFRADLGTVLSTLLLTVNFSCRKIVAEIILILPVNAFKPDVLLQSSFLFCCREIRKSATRN